MAVGDKFESIDAFYDADERRRYSGEIDYGVMWRSAEDSRRTCRVSLVEKTGEVYALASGCSGEPVEILAEGISEAACEDLLARWGEQDDLEWVRARLRPLGVPAGFSGYAAAAGEHGAWVVENGRRVARLDPSEEAQRSSPTGFSWGYGGSGPFALAHSILVHRTGNQAVPRSLGQQFKFEVIASPAVDVSFALSFAEVDAWLDSAAGQ